ncbi:hypothetical protein H9X96_20210 [Pedobacter sp. N36a]|uniref:hypothetical protein n=1 Tax=Pedobacter sp. N36a TaxID=2767996 RepID=UPI001656BDF5|nr:hypothetical protein [Pedobacter sp. N36a]MBC8988084.1 hypothetical protein [Pedobacter sp. N36a]
MEILPLILLVIIVLMVVFGKKIDNRVKEKARQSPGFIWLVLGIAAVFAIAFGAINANQSAEFVLFGAWFILFLIGLTLFAGVIDLFLKTSYFKYPGILSLLLMITYVTILVLEKKP